MGDLKPLLEPMAITAISGFDYRIHKVGAIYYGTKTATGVTISSSTTLETVLNAISSDITGGDSGVVIGFAGDTTYVFADVTVTFTDKQVYIDGGGAEFDISASDCSVFKWVEVGFTNHMRGGIRNCFVKGDNSNTSQVFIHSDGVCMDIYNISTRNLQARMVYNLIFLEEGGVSSSIRDCYIYAEYPIKLIGGAGAIGEASRTLIDHCHISGAELDDGVIGIDIQYGHGINITHCNFTHLATCIRARDTAKLIISKNNIGDYTSVGLDIESIYTVITENTIYSSEDNVDDIKLYTANGGVVSNNVFHVNGDNVTTINAVDSNELVITGNQYTIAGTHSGSGFIVQTDTTYSNWWVVGNNNVIGVNPQTGTCMSFTDIRNSYIHNNNVGCSDGSAANGSIPWSVANLTITIERNTIIDRYREITGNVTAIMGETIIADATGDAITILLPTYHTYKGKRTRITIKKIDAANNVTLNGAGEQTIDGELTHVLTSQYETVTIESDGTNWYIV